MIATKRLQFFTFSLLAGALLPFAFAPHNAWPLAILSPALLLLVWQSPSVSPRFAAVLGLTYGLGLFGVGVSWVFVSIHHYGNTDIATASFLTFLFVAVLALFISAQGYFLKRFFKGGLLQFSLIGFPCSWVLFEWLRTWLFTGFPWLFLGYSQLDTFLSAYAPLSSVYAVSLAVLLLSGALAVALLNLKKIKILVGSLGLIVLIFGVGLVLSLQDFTKANPKQYTVSIVQGNIDPMHKFPGKDEIKATEESYEALTKAYWGSDLILWPESAIPLPVPYAKPYLKHLDEEAKKHNSTLITGLQIINEKDEYFNSMMALGMGEGTYNKYHLVPFGDFLPFDQWIRGLVNFFDIPMSSFKSGTKDQVLLTAGKLSLEPLICYEVAFPEQVRENLRKADAIVNLSEDGWFGSSWGPHQHLEIAQMRALETGRYLLRSTPSGITAIIDPKGRIVKRIPQFEATVLNGSFYSMQGETPWVKIGLWPLLIILILGFFLPGRWRFR